MNKDLVLIKSLITLECKGTGYTFKSLYFPSQTLRPVEYDIDEGSHSSSSFCAVRCVYLCGSVLTAVEDTSEL